MRITIIPVARTRRSASRRRIVTLLNETITLGMVLRQRYVHFAECLFNRVHHRVRTADEVFVVSIGRRQMAHHNLSIDDALLSLPSGWRIHQHMDDLEVETRLERFEFFPERNRFPVPAAVEQDDRALVVPVS